VAGAVVGIVGEEAPFVVVNGAKKAEVNRLGRAPRGGRARRVTGKGFFEAAADDLGETHLVVGSDTLGGGIEVIGDLDLGFDHGEGGA